MSDRQSAFKGTTMIKVYWGGAFRNKLVNHVELNICSD